MATRISRERVLGGLSARRQMWSAVGGIAALAGLTAVLRATRENVSLSLVFLLFFAAVVAISAAGGPLVGIAAAIAGFLLANFFFTHPLHTFNVADPEVLVELLIFLAVSGTVATLVDTATRRLGKIEQQSAEATRLEAANALRTALLRAVSHDLRTPLTTAKMATSSLLATDVELSAQARTELLTLADSEIDRLVRIVENLLDAGRLQAGALNVRVSTIGVAELVQRGIDGLPDPDRSRVEPRVVDGVTTIDSDPALLERVLANLLANALVADPSGTIAVVAQPDGTGGHGVRLDVIDHGPGLPPDVRALAFKPFQRLEDRGSTSGIGLGLSICSGLCEAVGAGLDLLDTPGGGLTARITVPSEVPA